MGTITIPNCGTPRRFLRHVLDNANSSSQRYRLPILTLPVLGGQLYVINSPKIIAAIERQPNTVSFWHVEASTIGKIAGLRADAADTVSRGVGDDSESFWLKGLRAIHRAMTPGKGFDEMILKATRTSVESLRQLESDVKGRKVNLWDLITHEITLSHTEAVYGQHNPYKDPSVESAFWWVFSGFE